jgi:hypothetical protein
LAKTADFEMAIDNTPAAVISLEVEMAGGSGS